MKKDEFTTWNHAKRKEAFDYLERQGVAAPNIGAWPAFEVAPKFGIWCVESKKQPGKIGWWVFLGDCPTDYVSEDGRCHPRAALGNLLKRWSAHVPYMKKGIQPPDVAFGDGSNLIELGDLLERRVEILAEWMANDELWKEN